MKGLVPLLAAAAVVTLVGCASEREVERVVIAGVVDEVDLQRPENRLVLIQLPPLPADLVVPDTTDGTVLVEVNQSEFAAAHGRQLPAWRKPKAIPDEAGDPLAPILVQVRSDIEAVTGLLDRVFADATIGAAEGRRTERQTAVLVLSDREWREVVTRITVLVERIDQVVQAIHGPPAYGDGSAHMQERTSRLWVQMRERSQDVVTAADLVARDGFASIILNDDVTGTIKPQIDALGSTAQRYSEAVRTQDAPRIVPLLRLLQRQIDGLEDSPAWIAGLAHQDSRKAPTTLPQRDETRARVVALRKAVVAAAGQWAANLATLIEQSDRPVLVHGTRTLE